MKQAFKDQLQAAKEEISRVYLGLEQLVIDIENDGLDNGAEDIANSIIDVIGALNAAEDDIEVIQNDLPK